MSSLQASAAENCPLPTEHNVSYSSLATLSAASPSKLISYGDDPLQFAELWLPQTASPERPAPLVALVHGGCWLNAYDIKHTHALSSALADMGYAVWSLEYRRTGDPGGGWPGTFEDVIAGLNALSTSELPTIDVARTALVGHSAGGHLVLLTAGSGQLKLTPKITIGLAPIVDLSSYARGDNSCQLATAKFIGGDPQEQPAAYAAATPALAGQNSPQIALHGAADSIVPLSQSQSLPRVIVPEAGHFDFLHPHTPAFQAFLRVLAEHL